MAFSGKVLAFEHNYSETIREKLSWLTRLNVHRDATTQRIGVRQYPRREMTYSFLPTSNQERVLLQNFLRASQKAAVVVPIWTDVAPSIETNTAGTTSVAVDTIGYDYDVGSYVMFWLSPFEYEVIEITAVNADSVDLAEPLDNTWPAGTPLMPARAARLDREASGRFYRSEARDVEVTASFDEERPSLNRVPSEEVQGYRNTIERVYELWKQPNATHEPLAWSVEHPLSYYDQQTGIVGINAAPHEIPLDMFDYAQRLITRSEFASFLSFLDRRQGRRIPFWLPTFERDFEATVLEFGGFKYLTNGYADWINLERGRKDIVIICDEDTISYDAGTFAPRRLDSVTNLENGLEQATVSMSDFSAGDLDKVRIAYLRYCHLETDDIELVWRGGSQQVVDTRFKVRETFNVPA